MFGSRQAQFDPDLRVNRSSLAAQRLGIQQKLLQSQMAVSRPMLSCGRAQRRGRSNPRNGDFSLMWITSDLPTILEIPANASN